ncbi:conserved protein of unknown function [Candidatus Filomicrobium marinum]|uniref:Uncharacterized protein n=2 Tax=Filomicrobium TaxID=119044 RepID=A0A0D6JBT3_9HYPH|nr:MULTISPECIES: hypothetical protein [Filomicrobium]MCV0370655.1 hypothetical protein [Filomicrobium sp.]CFX07185.1 conserved protein of unknown function [Candidatus Filomicrobium marinum]CPR16565.1 conserved protein of unknown function [Candidatus Filomicrobium marinum]SDP57831.1 hypothetical protein SAMN04488061_3386 [Filomicrobium insigne]
MSHEHINPLQWHQAIGYARQSCARIFRDGGTPADALAAFGITKPAGEQFSDWSKVVEVIAEELCAHQPSRRAA